MDSVKLPPGLELFHGQSAATTDTLKGGHGTMLLQLKLLQHQYHRNLQEELWVPPQVQDNLRDHDIRPQLPPATQQLWEMEQEKPRLLTAMQQQPQLQQEQGSQVHFLQASQSQGHPHVHASRHEVLLGSEQHQGQIAEEEKRSPAELQQRLQCPHDNGPKAQLWCSSQSQPHAHLGHELLPDSQQHWQLEKSQQWSPPAMKQGQGQHLQHRHLQYAQLRQPPPSQEHLHLQGTNELPPSSRKQGWIRQQGCSQAQLWHPPQSQKDPHLHGYHRAVLGAEQHRQMQTEQCQVLHELHLLQMLQQAVGEQIRTKIKTLEPFPNNEHQSAEHTTAGDHEKLSFQEKHQQQCPGALSGQRLKPHAQHSPQNQHEGRQLCNSSAEHQDERDQTKDQPCEHRDVRFLHHSDPNIMHRLHQQVDRQSPMLQHSHGPPQDSSEDPGKAQACNAPDASDLTIVSSRSATVRDVTAATAASQLTEAIPGISSRRNCMTMQGAAADARADAQHRTTLMIRNIPIEYCQDMLLQEWPIDGSYDLLYLPSSSSLKRCLGYAFMNFLSEAHAEKFRKKWHGARLAHFAADESLVACYADVQGLQNNIVQFKAKFSGRKKKYRQPVIIVDGRLMDLKEL